MSDLPSGALTFLFTDIEGSTRLWEEHPEGMRAALARHDDIVRRAIEDQGGYVFATGGDGFAAAFQRAGDALLVALEAQRDLAAEDWGDVSVLVRMGLHTGESEERDGDYFGSTLNKAARLMSAGHGGQVLVSQATVDVAGSEPLDGASFEDLGQHRLKDLERPARIFQLQHSALVSEFGPLRTLEFRPNNLPVQLTSFVGREDDVAETLKLLADARLLTLTGVGGSGKTRLSLQVAAEVLDDFDGGVWMVELAPVTDSALVPQAVETVLGVKDEPGQSQAETVASSIGEKRLLLILDNCEHVVAEVAELTASVLEQCPNLKVVATSRERLGVPGEVPFVVESLAIPPADAGIEAITGFDSVQLYMERASTVKQGFQVTSSNAETVAHICRRLDGMPLALELAAARTRVMSPEQIATRLDDRFALLTSGARTALPRQQTLLATIDWSYQLLDPDEQGLFESLSVFVGGFSLDSAEAVCATGGLAEFEVADLIHRLVDKSLVGVSEGTDGSIRYHLLETLRQFAASELEKSGRADEMRSRHATALLALVAEQGGLMQTGGYVAAMDLLSIEQDNIRAALRWAIDLGELEDVAQIGATMGSYWFGRGLAPEGLEWTREILGLLPDTDQAARTDFLSTAGHLRYLIGEYQAGKQDLEEALDIRRHLEDTRGVVRVLNGLALIADSTGEYKAERTYLEEAIELATQLGSPTHVLVANLGWTAWKSNDMEAARSHFQAALDETPEGNPNIHDYLFGLGWVEWVEGEFEEAENLAREASDLAQKHGSLTLSSGYQFGVALFAYEQEGLAAAAEALRESWPILLDSKEERMVHHWLYVAARAQPDPVFGVRVFAAVAALNDRSGFMFGLPIRNDQERSLVRLRTELTQDAFDKAWTEGYSATVEEAGAWALEGLGQLETEAGRHEPLFGAREPAF